MIEREQAFFKITEVFKRVIELKHFTKENPVRNIWDASKKGLGTVLQQQQNNKEGIPAAFESRFSTDFESKYSINDLEFLVVVLPD